MKKISCLIILSIFTPLNLKSSELSFNGVKNNFHPSDLYLMDRNNLELEIIRVDDSKRSLAWTTLNETSNALLKYLIISEDKSFYEHDGVDWSAIAKAAYLRILNSNSKRGASTITMQLVNVVNPEMKGIKKGINEKVDQINDALKLEKSWTKNQILEAYLNIIPFRGEIVGIRAASYAFFNKSPGNLNNLESALLVSMIRSPNAKIDDVALRTCRLLEDQNCSRAFKFTHKILSKKYRINNNKKLVNIVDQSFVVKNFDKNRIQTTLSKNIQKIALDALHDQMKNLKEQNLSDGAILVINNHTNEVIAYIANSGDQFSATPRFDNIRARRQAGSTLKPFIYAKALDENLMSTSSLVDDSPIDIPTGTGSIYFPRNYDNSFHGLVPIGVSLGSSLNVPAVKTLQLVGGKVMINLFKKLGFTRLEDEKYYGPSLALGSVDVTLWDLVHAYMGLHNNKIFKKETEDNIFQLLSDPENRRLTFGTDSILSFPFKVAVKTGTSKDMRDNWCIGFSKNYTVGVWVGNSNGKAMWNVSGITGAAPVFRAVMLELEKNNIKQSEINFKIAEKIERINSKILTQIHYPVDGEIIGFDNEIPEDLQRMPIEIENFKVNHQVLINKEKINYENKNFLWKVQKGKYELSLLNEKNELLQLVHFEVR